MPGAKTARALIGIGGVLAAGTVSACGSTPRGPTALGAEPSHLLPADIAAPAQGFVGAPGSVAASSDPGPIGKPPRNNYRFELTASRSGQGSQGLGGEPRSGIASEWDNRFDLDGELGYGDLVSLKLDGNFLDLRGPAEDEGFSFVDGVRGGWEHNRVNDMTVTLGAMGDRLRLTSRHASSTYRLSGPYSKRLTTKNKRNDDEGKERFLNRKSNEGTATLHRLDADIWNSANVNASVFGLYSEVDRYFESVELSGKDPFATSNRETLKAGATLGLGPVEVTLSRSRLQKADEADAPEERQYEATVGVDLDDVRSRIGDGLGEGFWRLAPSTAWVSVAQGTVEENSDRRGPEDRTEDVSFGLAWSWPGSYANLDFWHSRYDYRQPGAADYDWAGSGTSVGFGFSGGRWNVDIAFGFYKSENKELTVRSIDLGYDGTAAFTYRPEHLPDFSVNLYAGRYESDYVPLSQSIGTDAWEIGSALDFSKYLPSSPQRDELSLKLVYFLEGLRTNDDLAGTRQDIDHVVGLLLRIPY